MRAAGRPPATGPSTTERILNIAERLAQTRGFNGFSYADVAEELLITNASLHYHFPSKADLGCALISRYHVVFCRALDEIDAQTLDAREKLRRYVDLYATVMLDDRMCLCGMLAAEYTTLPAQMRAQLRKFFDANEAWLATVLESGRRAKRLSFHGTPQRRARIMLGLLEGSMLVARVNGDVAAFRSVAKQFLADLNSTPRA